MICRSRIHREWHLLFDLVLGRLYMRLYPLMTKNLQVQRLVSPAVRNKLKSVAHLSAVNDNTVVCNY